MRPNCGNGTNGVMKNNEHERLPFRVRNVRMTIGSYAFRDTVKLRRIIDQVLVWDANLNQNTEKGRRR